MFEFFSRKGSAKKKADAFEKPVECDIEFLFVIADGPAPEQISERLSMICEIAHQKEATVDSIVGSLAIIAMTDGVEPFSGGFGQRLVIVSELQKQLGQTIKIIHGNTRGFVGMTGGNFRFQFGIIIPQRAEIMEKLEDLSFGDACEFPGIKSRSRPTDGRAIL